ncbi:uncharacterized protein F4822DRAFT_407031 [Hypoxylon trugodes]|uniref:uncharacterized protein n=1 Tax=Hypoxylon trugodes TaxID=326681 RepID=UPI00219273E5|nr:uncharacterized protein F4822DRAFT_407031 [Hypoxylon trugodes]KAI1387584.1 hypothetical protein F4822DRAFT_407031 [Hypoxylon trugodes]
MSIPSILTNLDGKGAVEIDEIEFVGGESPIKGYDDGASCYRKFSDVFPPLSEPKLTLEPWSPLLAEQAFSNPQNFQSQSTIQVVKADEHGVLWLPAVDDAGIRSLLSRDASPKSPNYHHTLIVFFVSLHYNSEAQYERQVSISKSSFKKFIDRTEMHDAAIQDMLGRPDYWSAFGRRKITLLGGGSSYEFLCQHPRWLQKSRHDTTVHRAPCSVYLHHEGETNTSYYMISSAKSDGYVSDILRNLGIPDTDKPYTGMAPDVMFNPFFIHALVSGTAYRQSTEYLGDVRTNLMEQIIKVNDYSQETHPYLGDGEGVDAGRKKLEDITKKLHLVSQTCDSGIASADMSIELCREMLEAYMSFTANGIEDPASRQHVQDSMAWILKTWHCQKNWLISYKARKDTAMNFVYNLVTQQDNSVNIDIAHQTARHSSSMNTITVLTLIFLPGTFLAGVFSSGILENSETHGISDLFWPFIWFFIPLTLLSIAIWYWRLQLEKTYAWIRRKALDRRYCDGDPEKGVGRNYVK